MQQRYYDPMIPRFLSVDPVTAYDDPIGMFNRYRYAGSNPYTFKDPDGRCTAGLQHICGGSPTRARLGPSGDGGDNSDPESSSTSGSRNPWPAAAAAIGVLTADDATGVGVADDLLIPLVLGGALVIDQFARTYVTYTLTNASGQTYVGRTSGYGTPQQIVNARFATHHMRLAGYGNPTVDVSAQGPLGKAAIRGREQQLMDHYGGVGSPRLGNSIRGVAKGNPAGPGYHYMSNTRFGPLAPYTGILPYIYPR